VNVTTDDGAAGELFVDLFRAAAAKRERVAGAIPGGASQPFAVEVVDGSAQCAARDGLPDLGAHAIDGTQCGETVSRPPNCLATCRKIECAMA
jgi:hypothetical protein